jgi:DnaJ domain
MAEGARKKQIPGHEVLGVRPGASPAEAHKAFRRWALDHHPDRGGDPAEFQAGVEAYRSLVGRGPSRSEPEVVFYRKRRGLRIPAFRPWRRRAKRGGT